MFSVAQKCPPEHLYSFHSRIQTILHLIIISFVSSIFLSLVWLWNVRGMQGSIWAWIWVVLLSSFPSPNSYNISSRQPRTLQLDMPYVTHLFQGRWLDYKYSRSRFLSVMKYQPEGLSGMSLTIIKSLPTHLGQANISWYWCVILTSS